MTKLKDSQRGVHSTTRRVDSATRRPRRDTTGISARTVATHRGEGRPGGVNNAGSGNLAVGLGGEHASCGGGGEPAV